MSQWLLGLLSQDDKDQKCRQRKEWAQWMSDYSIRMRKTSERKTEGPKGGKNWGAVFLGALMRKMAEF